MKDIPPSVERFLICFPVVIGTFVILVGATAYGWDIQPGEGFGLGAVFALVVQFYVRKAPTPK